MSGKDATEREIEEFLWEFSQIRVWFVVEREKNIETRDLLGLSPMQIKDEIMSLGVSNYFSGPEPDDSGSEGEVWVFGKDIEERPIYIKLKVFTTSRGAKGGKCISFHVAAEEMIFPYN